MIFSINTLKWNTDRWIDRSIQIEMEIEIRKRQIGRCSILRHSR